MLVRKKLNLYYSCYGEGYNFVGKFFPGTCILASKIKFSLISASTACFSALFVSRAILTHVEFRNDKKEFLQI